LDGPPSPKPNTIRDNGTSRVPARKPRRLPVGTRRIHEIEVVGGAVVDDANGRCDT
jgi:hypothetical protein